MFFEQTKNCLTAAILMIAAGQANALSCTFTLSDPVAAYKTPHADAEQFDAITGQLRYPAGQIMPQTGQGSLPAIFTGKRLTVDGFVDDITLPIRVNYWCDTGDCGHIADGAMMLSFVPVDAPVIVLETGPCGSAGIWAPTQDALDRLTACAQGRECLSQPL